jgi:hypothetical protein
VSKKAARTAVKRNASEEKTTTTAPGSVSFGPAKKELRNLRDKLQRLLDQEGENLTIQDIINKIDKLDRVLICQVQMTRSF